jgi:hypothetical protein
MHFGGVLVTSLALSSIRPGHPNRKSSLNSATHIHKNLGLRGMDSVTLQKIVDKIMPRNGIAQDGPITLENARWIVPFKHLLYGKLQAFISDRQVQSEDDIDSAARDLRECIRRALLNSLISK